MRKASNPYLVDMVEDQRKQYSLLSLCSSIFFCDPADLEHGTWAWLIACLGLVPRLLQPRSQALRVPRPCAFVTCSTKLCANFLVQVMFVDCLQQRSSRRERCEGLRTTLQQIWSAYFCQFGRRVSAIHMHQLSPELQDSDLAAEVKMCVTYWQLCCRCFIQIQTKRMKRANEMPAQSALFWSPHILCSFYYISTCNLLPCCCIIAFVLILVRPLTSSQIL